MTQCSALNCKNKGVHTFPKDQKRRKAWENAIRIENFKAKDTSRLCSLHFRSDDYYGHSKYTSYEPQAKFLKKTAVPSIFPFRISKSVAPTAIPRQQLPETRCRSKLPLEENVTPSTSHDHHNETSTPSTTHEANNEVEILPNSMETEAAGSWRGSEGAPAAGDAAAAGSLWLQVVRVKEEPECAADERVRIKEEAEWSEDADVCVKQEAPPPPPPAAGERQFKYEVPLERRRPLEPRCPLEARCPPPPARESHSHELLRPEPPPPRRPPPEVSRTGLGPAPPVPPHPAAIHRQHPASAATSAHEYVCDTCSKSYKWRRYLIQHIRVTHGRAAAFVCAQCGKEFSQKGNLKRHALVHTGDKPYSCDVCPRRFAELGNLKVHQRIHTGVKPYSCQICSKEFGHLSHFNSHKRVHTGEKRYTCDICNNKFTRLSYFNMHKRIHTGEKPYTCERCKKTFSQNRYLKKHQCAPAND